MTYFLERYFNVDENGMLIPYSYTTALVRPCYLDYNEVVNIERMTGFVNDYTMRLGPAESIYSTNLKNKDCKNVDEWLIRLSLEESIIPDFETHNINVYGSSFGTLLAKTIDLHSNKVLYDNTKSIIDKILYDNTKSIIDKVLAKRIARKKS